MPSAHSAAAALGWHGVVVRGVPALGAHISAVVRVDDAVDRWRRANGWPPQSDPSWFRGWFEPHGEDRSPRAAVRLLGVLVDESEVQRALQASGSLLTLAPCAVVLPSGEHDPLPLMELDYYGLGVVTVDDRGRGKVLVPPEDRTSEFGPSLFGRWLLEVLYDRVLQEAETTIIPAIYDAP